MHDNLESYIKTSSKANFTGPLISKILANKIIQYSLSNVDEVYGVEAPLHYGKIYAGRCDLIASYASNISIIDFKNSKKMKKREWIEDYFMQLCAYQIAHNKMFGTNIQKGVVMMVSRDGKHTDFILEGAENAKYCDKWARRVEEFYKTS